MKIAKFLETPPFPLNFAKIHKFSKKSLKWQEILKLHLKYHYSYKVLRQGVKRAQKVQKVVKSAKGAKKCKKCSEVQKVAKVQKERKSAKSVKVMKSIKIPLKWTRNSKGLVEITDSYQNLCKTHNSFGFLWNFILFRNFRISRFLWKWIAFYDFI